MNFSGNYNIILVIWLFNENYNYSCKMYDLFIEKGLYSHNIVTFLTDFFFPTVALIFCYTKRVIHNWYFMNSCV